jgi:hypothetical protein
MPVLRDFLYLDVDRVRSLLAQLEGGVVEQSVERLTKSRDARAGGSLFGLFDLGGGLLRERATEQTKTLHDALFTLFEDAARSSGLFDLDVDVADEAAWTNDLVHEALRPGQLLQITAPTRVLDAQHFRERVDRFAEWPRLVATFTLSDQLEAIKSPKERDRKVNALVAQSFGGDGSLDSIRKIGEFIDLFLAGQISLRQFPCGASPPKLAFAGTLLGRPGYLQEEREALFAKYGSSVTEWTVVSQVATVTGDRPPMSELAIGELVNAADQIDRATLEDAAMQLMQLLESTGVAEGPTYPSIAVTPLAVYREFRLGS